MTCSSTDEGWETTLALAVLAKNGWVVVSELMLISLLSVSMDPCDVLWVEAALTLAPLCGDINSEDLLRPSVPSPPSSSGCQESAAVLPNSNSVGVSVGTSILLTFFINFLRPTL